MNAIVDMYNARRKDKAFANEVLDDVAEQLTQLLEELGKDKMSFEALKISFEEKAFFDILEALAKKYGFYRADIKAELKVDIILKLADYRYPPVTQDEVYKEVLELRISGSTTNNYRKNI